MERLLSTTCILTLLAAGLAMGSAAAAPGGIPGKPPGKGEDTVGNNLSFPVIFSDGVEKATRYPTDWSTGNPIPAPQFGGAFTTIGVENWYHQQDPLNLWGAETYTHDGTEEDFFVDWIDWGDNLEARDWNVNSVVRVETVLYADLADPPMKAYTMRYLSGEGPNEMWGTNGVSYDELQATVYSHCARLTIQRLTKDRDDATLSVLWDFAEHQWEGDVESPVFNLAVWEAGDGPGFYNAENNVPGKIIYGYNWNVRKTGKVAGDYRLTYSLDAQCGTVLRTTSLLDAQIIQPTEEEEEVAAEPGEVPQGGTAVLVAADELTYIDVRILPRSGGGGRGGGGGGGGGQGGPGGPN